MNLRDYQLEAVKHMDASKRCIYGDAAGSGKTAATACWLDHCDFTRMLIAAPGNKIIHQWEQTFWEWTEITPVVITTGSSPAKRWVAYERFLDDGEEVALIIPYSILLQDQERLIKMRFDAFVADESHHLKNRQGQTHKAAVKVARRTPHLALVTGTPLLNDAEELWASLHLIDPKGYRSFWAWAREHFWIEETTFHGRVSRPVQLVGDLKDGHDEILRQQIGPHLLKRPMAELLPDLPDLVEYEIPVTLTTEEQRHYDSMAKHAWMKVDGAVTFAPNEVTKMTRLRQLVSDLSSITGDDNPAGSKVLAAADLVRDLSPEQVVVMVSYKAAAHRLVEELGPCAVLHTGDMNAINRELALEEFMEGEAQVLVGTHETLGEGVDGLQVARNMILLDLDWTPARNEQAIARIRRSGQSADEVHVYHLFAEGTVDEMVLEANNRKIDVINLILGRKPADEPGGSVGSKASRGKGHQ